MSTPIPELTAKEKSRFEGETADQWFGHPRGLPHLFLTEMWERFCFFGLRSILVFFLVKHHGFTDAYAVSVYAGFAALSTFMILLGGVFADRIIGARRTVLIGAALMIVGSFALVYEGSAAELRITDGGEVDVVSRDTTAVQIMFAALGFISIGTGLLKCAATTLCGRLYGDGDKRRDAGFTIYYVGINLGAGVAALVIGYIGETVGWSYGFGLAGIGMLLGLWSFLSGNRHYGEAVGRDPVESTGPVTVGRTAVSVILAITGVALAYALLQFNFALRAIMTIGGLIAAAFILFISITQLPGHEKMRMIAVFTILFFGVIYWTLFVLTGSAINLFIDAHADRTVFGQIVPAATFQSLEPLFAIALGPLIAWGLMIMARADISPSFVAKIVVGIGLCAMSYVVIGLVAVNASSGTLVSLQIIVIYFLLLTVSDLLVAPTALSNLSRLAPPEWTSLAIGLWYLTAMFGHLGAGWVTNLFIGGSVSAAGLAPGLGVFGELFLTVAVAGGAGAAILAMLSPFIRAADRPAHRS